MAAPPRARAPRKTPLTRGPAAPQERTLEDGRATLLKTERPALADVLVFCALFPAHCGARDTLEAVAPRAAKWLAAMAAHEQVRGGAAFCLERL